MIPQLNNIFQIAYATNDVERAAAVFKNRFGTGAFSVFDFDGVMKLRLAFAGQVMIELIQPINDPTGLYTGWIAGSEAFALRHHHFGVLVNSKDELAAIRAAHVDSGTAVAAEGSMPGSLDFLYVDTTVQLGHYLEYVHLDAAGRAMFASVEGSIFKGA